MESEGLGEPMDEELATALALSISEGSQEQSPSNPPVEQSQPKPSQPETISQSSQPSPTNIDYEMLDDEEEQMRAALALSLQQEEISQPSQPQQNPEEKSSPSLKMEQKSEEKQLSEKSIENISESTKVEESSSVPNPPPPPSSNNESLQQPFPFDPSSALPLFGNLSSLFSVGSSSSQSNSPSRSPRNFRRSPPRSPALPRVEQQTKETEKPKTKESAKPPVEPDFSWLNHLAQMQRKLNVLIQPASNPLLLDQLLREAWKNTKQDYIKERLILVDNLPLLGADKREELSAIVERTFAEHAGVRHLWLPVDLATKQTKGFAFLEVVSPQKVAPLVKKMHRYKLKLPSPLAEEAGNLRRSANTNATTSLNSSSGSLKKSSSTHSLKSSLRGSAPAPRGTIEVLKFSDLEKSEDPRLYEFLQSKLVDNGTLTPQFQQVLTQIFHLFAGTYGALGAQQLNELQLCSNGKPLTNEQIEFAFKIYKTTQIGAQQEIALTLEGFLDLYLKQCIEAPLDTWEELSKLGYDLNLNRNSYFSVEHALESQKNWTLAADLQLVEHVEMIYTDFEVSSPLFLALDHLEALSPSTDSVIPSLSSSQSSTPSQVASLRYPKLAKVETPALRLRFEFLRQLNHHITLALPLVDLDRKHEGSDIWLLSLCRGLIFHNVKMDFIYDILDKTSIQGNQPTVSIDRLKLASKKEKEIKNLGGIKNSLETSDSILQQTMFGLAFQQLKTTPSYLFRQKKPPGTDPHFAIRIVFKNENVQGEGGPYRQFFTDVSKELQGTLPLFVQCPNAQQGLGDNREKWLIAPSANLSPHLSMFEFLGRLMGLAVSTGVLLPLDLTAFFWKPLVDQERDIGDLKEIDLSSFNTLKYFANSTKEDLEKQCPHENFTTWLSDHTLVPVTQGGESKKITFENRKEYIEMVEQVRLNEDKIQMMAIKRGLVNIVPIPLLQLCTWKDLEWKVCGKPYIDINLLKRHTNCSGVSPDAPHIHYFWQTLHEFSQTERRGFLRFVWAQERLPVNDEEFERSKVRMMIKPFPSTLSDPNMFFPKADTCFFNIMLPEYTSQKFLKERLLYAIYTDSHSMNADEPQEDELSTLNGVRSGGLPIVTRASNLLDYSSSEESEE